MTDTNEQRITELEKTVQGIVALLSGEDEPQAKESKPAIIETSNFSIGDYTEGEFWARNKDGEGMAIKKEVLDEFLARYFEDNF